MRFQLHEILRTNVHVEVMLWTPWKTLFLQEMGHVALKRHQAESWKTAILSFEALRRKA